MLDLSKRKYQRFYRLAAEKSLELLFREDRFGVRVTEEAAEEIIVGLATRLKEASRQTIDWLYMEELKNSGVYQAYLDQDASQTEVFDSIDHDLLEILEEEGADFLDRAITGQGIVFCQVIETYQMVVTEVLTRLDASRQELESALFHGAVIHEVNAFHCDAGDSHNHGRTTVVLGTDAGKCVYKPHDLSIDRFMGWFFERFFSDISRIPMVICKGEYGFCEFIENTPVTGENSLDDYFEKLGGLCCIFRMLHSQDLHRENLLCDGVYPILIDLETIVSPVGRYVRKRMNAVYPELERTLYASCLFPVLNGRRELSPLFDRSSGNLVAPVLDGERITVADRMEPFLCGYEAIYHRILGQKEELEEALNGLTGCIVRVILRKTSAYVDTIYKSRHPGRLEKPDRDRELEGVLEPWFSKSGAPSAHRIAAEETEALLRGDVPYFYTSGSSLALYSEGECLDEAFFLKSCLENARDSLRSMTEESLSFECRLFSLAVKRALKPKTSDSQNNNKEPDDFPVPGKALSREVCIQKAEEIFQQIMEEAVLSPEGKLLFFTRDTEENSAMEIMQNGFADGYMGVALFAAALLASKGSQALHERETDLLEGLLRQQEQQLSWMEGLEKLYPTECPVGFYAGLAGWLFALDRIRALLKTAAELKNDGKDRIAALQKQADHSIRRLLKLTDRLMLRDTEADAANGIAGLLHVLCLLSEEGKEDISKKQIRNMAELILEKKEKSDQKPGYWKMQGESRYLSGMAHGQCGIGSALRKAGLILQDERYIREAQRAYEFEDRIYSEKLGGWPDLRSDAKSMKPMHGYCSGGPGIGLEMLGMQGELAERNLKRALDKAVEGPLYYRDHLCCGNSAVAEFLIEAGSVLGRKELTDRAGQLLAAMTLRAEENKGYFIFSDPQDNRFRCIPSLYFGSVGVGYELLRYADPGRIPCPLLK